MVVCALSVVNITDVLLMCSVGRPKHVRVMAGALEGDLFIGPKAEVRHTAYSTHTTVYSTQHYAHLKGCQNRVIICVVCRNTGVCYRFGTQWNTASLKTGMIWSGSGSTFTPKNSFRPSVRR